MPLLEDLLQLLFPERHCLFCQKPVVPGRFWCDTCWEEIKGDLRPALLPVESSGLHQGMRYFSPRAIEVVETYSAGFHEGKLRRALLAHKYGGREYLARGLGEMLLFLAREVGLSADLVIPVPLHPHRQWERGFNQAEALARVVARGLGSEVTSDVLLRRRETIPQSQLNKEERRKNVKGAFFIQKRANLELKRILLVDDIYTTGATLQECARALLEAGAQEVKALTVARRRFPESEKTPGRGELY